MLPFTVLSTCTVLRTCPAMETGGGVFAIFLLFIDCQFHMAYRLTNCQCSSMNKTPFLADHEPGELHILLELSTKIIFLSSQQIVLSRGLVNHNHICNMGCGSLVASWEFLHISSRLRWDGQQAYHGSIGFLDYALAGRWSQRSTTYWGVLFIMRDTIASFRRALTIHMGDQLWGRELPGYDPSRATEVPNDYFYSLRIKRGKMGSQTRDRQLQELVWPIFLW